MHCQIPTGQNSDKPRPFRVRIKLSWSNGELYVSKIQLSDAGFRSAKKTGPDRSGPAALRAFVLYQKPLAFKRPFETTLPLNDGVGTALPRIAALIVAALALGLCAAYSAAAPVTCGVAIEVPL